MSIVVTRARGLITVQDLGRPGRMHEALPRGGALVSDLFVLANRCAQNSDGAAALEVLGEIEIRAERDLLVGTDAERVLRAGSELVVASAPHRVAYLAVHGGIAAPEILGSRATHLSAGIGSLVRAGDRFDTLDDTGPARDTITEARRTRAALDGAAPIRVVVGPDRDAFPAGAIERLCAGSYRIDPTSNRVGTRLAGSAIERSPAYRETSRPMVLGGIEIPAAGAPIVLGPEHPTTGGYPLLAVIAVDDLARFFAVPLGGTVRFAVQRTSQH